MDEMLKLVNILNKASDSYYNSGVEIMSNKEYDKLFDKLRKMEKKTGIKLPNSPTINVGFKPVSKLEKVKHEYPALSLDKTKNINEFPKIFNVRDKMAVIMWKLDGSTLQLTYDNGFLTKAVTRGNGEVGLNVLNNIRYVKGLPKEIKCKDHLVVRGEIIMTYDEFNRINDLLPIEEQYKNPRNLANATLTMLDTNEIKNRELRFKAFKLVYLKPNVIKNETFYNQMLFLKKNGFDIVEYKRTYISDLVKNMNVFSDRVDWINYPVDGLVVAANDVLYAEKQHGTGHNPNKLVGYAFKWKDETVETKLTKIEWSPSRTGLLNPIAVFEPVELEGTTVTRASLSNVSIVEKLRLRPGNRITVYKANKIIPQVDSNLDFGEKLSYKESHPDKCPCCYKKPYVIISDGNVESAYCKNPDCPAKQIKKFTYFASRNCMDITGFSEATIEKFVKSGIIKEYADFFKLELFENEIVNMEGFGRKSFDNLIKSSEKSRHTSFVPFISSLGIPGIGREQSKLLNKQFNGDVLKFFKYAYNKRYFSKIDGIGPVLENNIWEWSDKYLQWFPSGVNPTQKPKNINFEIANLMMQLEFFKDKNEIGNKLSGMTFVITGTLNYYKNRDELIKIIENNGGNVSNSISSKTKYLINNDINSTSSKNKKAKGLGIKIISEMDFNNILNNA